MTPHRKFRCTSTVLILYALWTQWKILVAPEVPMPYTSSIELSTVASHREHVKGAAAESSAPDVPVAIGARRQSNDVSTSGKLIRNLFSIGKSDAHRCNASEQLHQPATVSATQRLLFKHSVTGSSDAPPSGVLMPYVEKGQRLQTASSTWWPIYTPQPDHLKLAGVQKDLIHIKKHLQTNQRIS